MLNIVLILIILEYIYIQLKLNNYVDLHRLNPYYTGIHLHILLGCICACINVLILIILEYIYIMSKEGFEDLMLGLNPYYTGIHLHILIIRLL